VGGTAHGEISNHGIIRKKRKRVRDGRGNTLHLPSGAVTKGPQKLSGVPPNSFTFTEKSQRYNDGLPPQHRDQVNKKKVREEGGAPHHQFKLVSAQINGKPEKHGDRNVSLPEEREEETNKRKKGHVGTKCTVSSQWRTAELVPDRRMPHKVDR